MRCIFSLWLAAPVSYRLGCWPIALAHQSEGVYGHPPRQERFDTYLVKWRS